MKQEAKLLEEFLQEEEDKKAYKFVGVIHTFRIWGGECKPFVEKAMLWAWKKGQKTKLNKLDHKGE